MYACAHNNFKDFALSSTIHLGGGGGVEWEMWLEVFCNGGVKNIFFPTSRFFMLSESERVAERIKESYIIKG